MQPENKQAKFEPNKPQPSDDLHMQINIAVRNKEKRREKDSRQPEVRGPERNLAEGVGRMDLESKSAQSPIRRPSGGGGKRNQPSDPEFSRPALTGEARLFQPGIDSPESFNVGQKKDERTPKQSRKHRRKIQSIANSGDAPKTHSRELGKPVILKSSSQKQVLTSQSSLTLNQTPPVDGFSKVEVVEEEPVLLREPEVPPISHEQLIKEAKSIYAAMLMVEKKCVEVDRSEMRAIQEGTTTTIDPTRYQAYVVLHRTLLYEQYDFFLACFHPAASASLRGLPTKYGMAGRLWKTGIHTFLEILRNRLPESLEHMLGFLNLAYGVAALLYETIPAHTATWIECLGDLARYRMAIEDRDQETREIWIDRARGWYNLAADRFPYVGRLYHHLAILARQNPVEQLSLYLKSLTVPTQFAATRESILTLFESANYCVDHFEIPTQADFKFVQLHAMNFQKIDLDKFTSKLLEFKTLFTNSIDYCTDPETFDDFLPKSYQMAISNIAGIFQYGAKTGRLCKSAPKSPEDEAEKEEGKPGRRVTENLDDVEESSQDATQFQNALELAYATLSICLERPQEPSVLPHIYCWCIFLHNIFTARQYALVDIEKGFPWVEFAAFMNYLIGKYKGLDLDMDAEWPIPRPRPLPNRGNEPLRMTKPRALQEEYAVRSLIWVGDYFPEKFYDRFHVDDDDRYLDDSYAAEERVERILWTVLKICSYSTHLVYDAKLKTVTVSRELLARLEVEVEELDQFNKFKREEESDMEMADAEDFEEGVDESTLPEEMRTLLERERALASHLKGRSAHTKKALPKEEISRNLQKGYTVVCMDTNFLLDQPSVFKGIVESGEWNLVLPNPVIIELQGLSRNRDQRGKVAHAALKTITQAISKSANIRIVTTRGNDVTGSGFFKERIGTDEGQSLDESIIQVAANEGKKLLHKEPRNDTAPVVLLTGDRNMRNLAQSYQVFSLSPEAWKQQFGLKRKASFFSRNKSPKRISGENNAVTIFDGDEYLSAESNGSVTEPPRPDPGEFTRNSTERANQSFAVI